MNSLPCDILNTIHKYKHQLEFSDVINELRHIRINCRYTFSSSFIKYARYITCNNEVKPCIDINNIDVKAYEILDLINSNKFNLI